MLWQWANDRTQVYILDLDGTLMPSAEIDNQCYWQSVFECFETQHNIPDLHGFGHVTDSGILHEWCNRELGRQANEAETRQIKSRFLQLLEQASLQHAAHFSPFAGVEEWLEAVRQNPAVFAGIATGGWEHSARLKLELSGLDRFSLPLASSDDAKPRTDIMQIAASKVGALHPNSDVELTYVGDGAWDLQASLALDWAFIGIADGPRAAELKKAGARHVQADFTRV